MNGVLKDKLKPTSKYFKYFILKSGQSENKRIGL